MCESICVRLVTFFCGLGFCFFAVQPGISAHLGQPAHLEISETEPIIERGFMLNDPNYAANRLVYGERMDALTARLIARQKEGGELACSDQMLIEARWLLEHTTDWARLDAQLARLAESLNHTDQTFATLQSPRDGAWGVCYNEWFHKLDATVDGLNALADNGEAPRYPLVFLRRIADRDSLLSYLEGLLVSDIERTGVDQRDELGAVTGALSQMLFKSYLRQLLDIDPQGFVVTDGYVDAYRGFLDSWQEPSTGYWGAWYRTDSGLHKSTDLSLTFHTVSYRRGDVERWPELIDTTLAIKKLEYSYGWMHNVPRRDRLLGSIASVLDRPEFFRGRCAVPDHQIAADVARSRQPGERGRDAETGGELPGGLMVRRGATGPIVRCPIGSRSNPRRPDASVAAGEAAVEGGEGLLQRVVAYHADRRARVGRHVHNTLVHIPGHIHGLGVVGHGNGCAARSQQHCTGQYRHPGFAHFGLPLQCVPPRIARDTAIEKRGCRAGR